MPRLRLLPLAVVVVVMCVPEGCSGGKKTSGGGSSAAGGAAGAASAASEAACRLLTPADIKAALHFDVAPGRPFEGGVALCGFRSVDGTANVNVLRYQPAGDLIKNASLGAQGATRVSGIGDEAVVGRVIGQITVRKGDVGFTISVVPPPDQPTLERLARVALGRL